MLFYIILFEGIALLFSFSYNLKHMRKLLTPFLAVSLLLAGCNHSHEEEHNHNQAELESLAYTLYTDKTELFLEFKPLVSGKEARFAAHFTHLGEYFKPFTEGSIQLNLEVNGKTTTIKTDSLMVPGIFRLRMTPQQSGKGRLVFNINVKGITDQIIINEVTVYPNEQAALSDQKPEEAGSNEISYLKEQAWKTEFANEAIKKRPFNDIIKTTGQILSAQGDEIVVAAKSSGIVFFEGGKTAIGSEVNNGELLFVVSSSELTEENIDARFKEAKANYEKAKTDYERGRELVKNNIISQKDFQQLQLQNDNAHTTFNALAKNYAVGGKRIPSPMNGYIKNIFVAEGQYVKEGEAIATISQNKRLVIKAEVHQNYFSKLPSIQAASFKTTYDNRVYNTEDMNGKVLSYGRSVQGNTPFIPITFEIDNKGAIIPGSYVEVFLKTDETKNALVVPVSALLEEQGNFYVYVQTAGESFEKREVKLGTGDGINVQILSGISERDRVVTKGAYQIKLSTMSGTMPAHGHEH
jgi:membrane fusion protein, heavy metal efflux system